MFDSDDHDARDLAALQGIWEQVAFEENGVADPPDSHGAPGALTTIADHHFAVRTAEGQLLLEGSFVLDATTVPKSITWIDTVGEDQGKPLPAIYRLDGDHFAFIAADAGTPRPTVFRTEAGQTMRTFVRKNMKPDTRIAMQTPRLVLDTLRPDDAAALFACRGDPTVARYQGWRPAGVDEAAAFIARQADVAFGSADSWYQFAIRRRENGEFVGDLGMHLPAIGDDAVELGISLSPAHQSHGYAREAMAAALDRVFGPLGYRRAVASVDPRNAPCIALMRALGFRQEAHHVESLRVRGEWVDDMVFALLAREWTRGAYSAANRSAGEGP